MVSKDSVREELGITKRWIYLDNAATSPMRRSVFNEICEGYEDIAENGDLGYDSYLKRLEECRENIARFMGVSCDNLAFMKNTSEGLNTARTMLEALGKREHRYTFVTTDMEYPSNLLPWIRGKNRVIRNKDHRIELEDIERAVDEDTIALAISQVEFSNGFRNDLKEIRRICNEKGARLVVDVVQSLGVMDAENYADIACGASYKWLMGPYGVGLFYVSRELMEEAEPPFIGHNSIYYDETMPLDYRNIEMKKGARIFETGNVPFPLIFALSRSVEGLASFGKRSIEREALKLSGMLMEGMNLEIKTPAEQRGAIVGAEGNMRLVEDLKKKGVSISARDGLLRFSPHFWNTEEEIQRTIDIVNNL
jgi:selenocysteine lyase/cysteine desulfurase